MHSLRGLTESPVVKRHWLKMLSTYNTTVSKITKKSRKEKQKKRGYKENQNTGTAVKAIIHPPPPQRHGDPQKVILITIKEPTNIISKEPNMPTRAQAKKAHRHHSQAKPPEETIHPNDQGIKRNPKPPSPRQHPHPTRLGATSQVMKPQLIPDPPPSRQASLKGNSDTEPTSTSLPIHPRQRNDPQTLY